nr:hypothetical protein [Rhizobium leucaenae]
MKLPSSCGECGRIVVLRLLSHAWRSRPYMGVFKIAFYQKCVSMLSGCFPQGIQVWHVVALDLGLIEMKLTVDLPFGTFPVLKMSAFLSAFVLPDGVCPLSDFLFEISRCRFRYL